MKTLIIGGVTASGKSELAMAVAENFNGIVINADSVQLYKDLPTLTARPNAADQLRVPHALYGILPPHQEASAAFWLKKASVCVEQVLKGDQQPIVTGGTGLYLNAMQYGLAEIPTIDDTIRNTVRSMGIDEVSERLAELDPYSHHRLPKGDSQRRKRALEVVLSTGVTLESWHMTATPEFESNQQAVIIMPPRQQARARARDRVLQMLDGDVLAEVAELREKVGDPLKLPIRKTLGLSELLDVLDGKLDIEVAVDRVAIRTGQYIKRQETWFKRRAPNAVFIEHFGASKQALTAIGQLLDHAAS